MSKSKSDRRWFLKMLPLTAAGAGIAASLPVAAKPETPEFIPLEEGRLLTEAEMIAMADCCALAFGLKPRKQTLGVLITKSVDKQ